MKCALQSLLTIFLISMTGFIGGNTSLSAQELIDLTFESAVDIAMKNSYRIRQLELGIERTRYRLKANRAALKSRVYMNLRSPDINSVSDYEWNSILRRDEIIRQNTRLWQMDLSIKQPVVFFGFPTNGYLSLNNKVYRYLQKENGGKDVTYYNRHFLKFEQPLFRPNTLKNNIEDAELDLEENELDYIADQVRLIDQISNNYYDLFELKYMDEIYLNQVKNLEKVFEIARTMSQKDTTRVIDAIQARIELANAQENLLKNQSDLRIELAEMKQRLGLSEQDSLKIQLPRVNISPVTVDLEKAVSYGFNIRPSLSILNIRKRKDEIDINNAKGWDSFYVNLEMTYGLEKQEEYYDTMWDEYDNSYSVSINAYIPIWDWGRRKARIEAEKITLKRTELDIEDGKTRIKSEIMNAIANLEEYQQRAINLKDNINMIQEITNISIQNYEDSIISINDILRVVIRQRETESNFLDAYLGYRKSLLELMLITYYDYENDIPLIEKLLAG